MNISEVIACIENIAPLAGQADWDACGVQIAGEKDTVSRMAVTIDPTPEIIAHALNWDADMVLTHHPLYMEPKALHTPGRFLDVVRMAMKSKITLYTAHTSLDVQPSGPAGWLFRALGLTGLSILEPNGPEMPGTGFGFMGTLPQAMDFAAFAALLGEHVDREFWTTAGQRPASVKTVAYCTGSGGGLIPTAARAGADVFITGDLKYHLALEADVCTIDVGHFSLEERMTAELADLMTERLGPAVDIQFFPGREPFSLLLPENG